MIVWTFLGYLAFLILIGFVARRRTKDLNDFVLADRKLGVVATSLSYEVTAYSAWLMIAFPGRAFSRGLAAIWVGVACVIGDALNWLLISKQLREETEKLRALTMPEYLDRKFHREGSHSVRIAASLAVGVFMLVYLWSQIVAAGKAIQVSIDMSYVQAVLLSTFVIMCYTFQGGYRAVVWVDVLQGLMMILALVVLPVVCLIQLGGWGGLMAQLDLASADAAASGNEEGAHLGELFAGLVGLVLFRSFFEDAGVGAGYIGQPHICTRFMSMENPRHMRVAMLVSILFAMMICAGAVTVGLVAHGWFRNASMGPETALQVETMAGQAAEVAGRRVVHDTEKVLLQLVSTVFPGWLAGFVLSAIMADIISSAAGYLITGASSAVEDVYHRLFRRNAQQRELLLAGRLSTLVLGGLAGALALSTDPLSKTGVVYYLVLYAWGGLAGAFSAPVFMAIYFRRMTRAGCLAGIIVGSLTSVIWHNIWLAEVAYELIPAIALSALATYIVSLFTQPRGAESGVDPTGDGVSVQ